MKAGSGILIIVLVMLLSACSGINAVKKTTFLDFGMTKPEVRNILGSPEGAQHIGGLMVWQYSLHKSVMGFVPYFLAFDKQGRLVGWESNLRNHYTEEGVVRALQRLWVESLPKEFKEEVLPGKFNEQDINL
jgi:hypothetical protein